MVREANIYDIPRINELGSILEENFKKLYNINEMLEDGLSKVIVYEENDLVIGYIIATDLGFTCDIISLVVDENYRNKHVATNLLNYLISDLSENLELMSLEVSTKNKSAISLYEKFGFEIVNIRKKYYKDNDAYLMARKGGDNE